MLKTDNKDRHTGKLSRHRESFRPLKNVQSSYMYNCVSYYPGETRV